MNYCKVHLLRKGFSCHHRCFVRLRSLSLSLSLLVAGPLARPALAGSHPSPPPAPSISKDGEPGTSERNPITLDVAAVAKVGVAAEKLSKVAIVGNQLDEKSARRAGMTTEEIASANLGLSAGAAMRASCVGSQYTYSYFSWWQGTVNVLAVSSCTANGVAAILAGFGGLYAVLSALSAAAGGGLQVTVLTAMAAGLLAAGSAAAAFCNRNGTGSTYRWAPRLTAYWCTQQ
jgi:hypothetical protein